MIRNGDFSAGTHNWAIHGQDGDAHVSWDVNFGHLCVSHYAFIRTVDHFHLVKNDVYTLNFTAWASGPTKVHVQTPQWPLDPNLDVKLDLTESPHQFSFTFSPANEAGSAFLQFRDEPDHRLAETVCLQNISMRRIDRSGYREDAGPPIKVNQVGYLPDGPKRATLVTNVSHSIQWQLRHLPDYSIVVLRGNTTPYGFDESSGQWAHVIDFQTPTSVVPFLGSSFMLSAGDEDQPHVSDDHSFEFPIWPHIYEKLSTDSLEFFYHQRSGIAIDGDLVGQQYARDAGHIGIAPNQGDTLVPCQESTDALIAYGEPWGCNYSLDVTKGWYDAGDQGKYAVSGGISTWQLLSTYERAQQVAGFAVGDGLLRIPENHNGIPDVLDEARWELEFMLGMQVPQGSAPQLINRTMTDVSGMVHHKMHDNQWTGLPMDPAQDPKLRELHRPSTAATLNLAATAAQAARLFTQFDTQFASRLLEAARTAYDAAEAHPAIYAPDADWDLGGGAYKDHDVTDEFYWAACELFLSTKEERYAADIAASKWHSEDVEDVFGTMGFLWSQTQAMGRMSLATVPNALADIDRVVASVVAGADKYISFQQNQAYDINVPYLTWGSNSNQLNIVQVMATAYDVSGDARYRDGALAGLDYVLGRNALAQSYVTGHGTKYSQNQHSRLYAHQLDPRVPRPPAGYMAGGANQDPTDPPADDVLTGCAPQHCYVDDVNSYSTNEVAINWNSALAWVSSWAADQGGSRTDSGPVIV